MLTTTDAIRYVAVAQKEVRRTMSDQAGVVKGWATSGRACLLSCPTEGVFTPCEIVAVTAETLRETLAQSVTPQMVVLLPLIVILVARLAPRRLCIALAIGWAAVAAVTFHMDDALVRFLDDAAAFGETMRAPVRISGVPAVI